MKPVYCHFCQLKMSLFRPKIKLEQSPGRVQCRFLSRDRSPQNCFFSSPANDHPRSSKSLEQQEHEIIRPLRMDVPYESKTDSIKSSNADHAKSSCHHLCGTHFACGDSVVGRARPASSHIKRRRRETLQPATGFACGAHCALSRSASQPDARRLHLSAGNRPASAMAGTEQRP